MTLAESYETSNEKERPIIGEVVLLKQEQVTDDEGREFTRRFVEVGDESDADPEKREYYHDEAEADEQALKQHKEWKRTVIRRNTKEVIIAEDNEVAKRLYRDEHGRPTQMMEWAKDFPTAIALEPLQRLENGGRMLPGGHLDERTLELFTYMADAIGIRSRARIYAQRLVEIAQEQSGAKPMNVISVGSGASVPNIEATKRVEHEQQAAINWSFYDLDPRALGFAHQLVEEAEFEYSSVDYGPFKLKENGEWEFTGRSYVEAFDEEDEAFDVVDALGLWEYLRDGPATEFANKLYAKVKPGGSMIVSNMLRSRPQGDYNSRAVGWPMLHRRNDEELVRIFDDAGIDSKNVTMTHAQDGVYVVAEIRKP